jgi:DNA helicase-2/ATP-dependent DNA helicase PcrA
VAWPQVHPLCFDSLKLIRLLRPDLKAYKLEFLLEELSLAGANSHLADDDVNATVQLVNYCYQRGLEVRPLQEEYLGRKGVEAQVRLLVNHYQAIYAQGVAQLDVRRSADEEPAVVAELRQVYDAFRASHWMNEVSKLDYIFRFFCDDVVRVELDPSLRQQLSRHAMELNTFKEADLCGASTIDDRIFVTTIHKAKGLEFDNVIVFDVVDGRLPNYYSENNPAQLAEDARKLYVAMSRAKKRLFICYSQQKQVGRDVKPQRLSRFMESVRHLFQS